MEFFNNNQNDNLKFKLNSDGIDLSKIEPRLILTTKENKNYFFIGDIKEGIAIFEMPELKLYEKGDNGKIKFEIISEDETYFPVWEDRFEIKTKAIIKLEQMISEIVSNKPNKPRITSDIIIEKPIVEKKESKENFSKVTETIKEKDLESNFDKIAEKMSKINIEEEIDVADNDVVKNNKEDDNIKNVSKIMKFDNF